MKETPFPPIHKPSRLDINTFFSVHPAPDFVIFSAGITARQVT